MKKKIIIISSIILTILAVAASSVYALWYISANKVINPQDVTTEVVTSYIEAESNKTYNGNCQLPLSSSLDNSKLTYTYNGTTIYQNGSYVDQSSSPIDVGTYNIVVSYKDKENNDVNINVSFNITAAKLDLSQINENSYITYASSNYSFVTTDTIDNYLFKRDKGLVDLNISSVTLADTRNFTINLSIGGNNAKNYELSPSAITYTAAVYYVNSSTTYYYSLVEKALSAAGSNTSADTIYVIPNNVSYNVTVAENCTLDNLDTLILPYSDEKWDYRTGPVDPVDDSATKLKNRFADDCDDMIEQNRKTLVTISRGVTFTIEGRLNIGGILGNRASGYQGLQGQTSGFYAEILLQAGQGSTSGAKISVSSGGIIDCRGYIKETAIYDNVNLQPQLTINNGAKLILPFVIYDNQGANATGGIYCGSASIGLFDLGQTLSFDGEACPFVLFDMPNIQILSYIYSGSEVTGLVSLHTDARSNLGIEESWNTDQFTLVGTANALLCINSGYITVRYKPANLGYTEVIYYEDNPTRTTVEFYGNCTFGAMQMILNAQIAKVEVNTAGVLFPFSYRWAFIIHNNATINVSNGIKFMNGCSLTIESGGTLNLNNGANVIFYNQSWTDHKTTIPYMPTYTISTENGEVATLQNLTPSSTLVVQTKTPTITGAATLLNNGTINVSGGAGIAGYVQTSNDSGVISIDGGTNLTISSLETNGKGGQSGLSYTFSPVDSQYITETANGYIGSSTNNSTFEAANIYESLGTYWDKKMSDITSCSIDIMSYTTSRNESATIKLNCIVTPTENSSTIISYTWTLTNSFEGTDGTTTLTPNGSSATLFLPRRGTLQSDQTCHVTVTVTYIDSSGVERTVTSEAGSYTSNGGFS